MLRRHILKKLMKKSSKKTPQSFVPQLYQLCPPWLRRCLPSLSVAYMNEPRAELRGSVHDPKWSPTRNDPQNRPKHEANWSAYRLLSPIPRARSIQPKFQPFRPGKSSPPQKVDPFFRTFSGWTDPLSFGPKFPEILVEWIAPLSDPPIFSHSTLNDPEELIEWNGMTFNSRRC